MVQITRQMVNQYASSVSQGTTPDGLFIREVTDFIPIISRTDEPMGRLIKQGAAENKLEIEWGQGDLVPRIDTLAAAVIDTTGTSLSVTNPTYYQVWDQIKVDDEVFVVKAIGAGVNGPLTTTPRGFGGSTAATHASGATIRILGPAVPEGANAVESPIAQGDVFINYKQILEYTWNMTHRGRVTPTYEIQGDRFKAELRKKMIEARLDLGSVALHSLKNKGDGAGDSSNSPSTTGGLLQHTTKWVTDQAGAPVTLTTIMETLQNVYKKVGQNDMGKTVMGSAFQKRVFNSFFDDKRRYVTKDETAKTSFARYDSDFGILTFEVHYDMPDTDLVIWNPADCKLIPYTGGNWATGMYSTQGWFDKGFLRGDMGYLWLGDDRRCRIKNISTTRSSYPNLV